MNNKTLLGISLTAAFAATMIFAQYAMANGDDHLEIVESAIAVSGDGTVLKASVTTEGPISQNGSDGAFGYGFLTNGTSNVLALTTHLCASDSPVQGDAKDRVCPDVVALAGLGNDPVEEHDDATFHAHVLDLKDATQDCKDATGNVSALEVDLASTVSTGNKVSPDWPVKVSGKTIMVGNVDTSDLDDSGVEAVVSFGIVPITSGSAITNLCLI
jgi:hypothetical protein